VDKRCGRCRATKPADEFGFKNRAKGLRQPWCRACERTYKAAWYLQHRAEHIEHVRIQRAALKERNRVRLLAYLSQHPCVDCGEGNLVVLDLDHLRDKRWDIAYMVSAGFPWATIEAEIARCQVLCANCHRIKTARERGFYDRKVRGQLFEAAGTYRLTG
jgi:5-methylcytosine-specific restriction endonuclease McrA